MTNEATALADVSEQERHALEHARYLAKGSTPQDPECSFDYQLVETLVELIDRLRASPQPSDVQDSFDDSVSAADVRGILPPTPAPAGDVREQPQHVIEGIILRRLHQKRIEGYTIETAKEIAEALAALQQAPATDAVIPLSMLTAMHDLLEELDDYSVVGTEAWVLYHQIETFIYPERLRVSRPERGGAAK
jgi:hypothetical protein